MNRRNIKLIENRLEEEQKLFLYLMKKDDKVIEDLIEQWKFDDYADKINNFANTSNTWKIKVAEEILMKKRNKSYINSNSNIKKIVDQMNKEYNSLEEQLDKVSRSIFTINKDIELINHEIMELSTELENLGISLNELNERILN
jgi:chromosome segregation ATPase